MVLIAKQDHEAFSHLLTRHLDSIHRYLVRLAGSTADADELAQETFLRVWLNARASVASESLPFPSAVESAPAAACQS